MLKQEKVDNLLKKVQKEGSEIDERIEQDGYILSVKRHPMNLSLNGYIQNVDNEPFDESEKEIIHDIFHGGITFRNKNNSKLGFSCTTAQDISPGVERDLLAMGLDVEEDNSIKRSYKSREFVIRNLKRTVERLKEENQKAWVF